MKPQDPGYEHGQTISEYPPDGSVEIWEWRFDDPRPLFDVSNSAGHCYYGLQRADAATLAGLMFKDENIWQVSIAPSNRPKTGNWHLVQSIPATPEPTIQEQAK